MRVRGLARLALLACAAAGCGPGTPPPAPAPAPTPDRSPPSAPAPQDTPAVGRRTVASGLWGEAAIAVNRLDDGRLEVTAAVTGRNATLTFRRPALRAWADTTATLVERRIAPPRTGERVARSVIEEEGSGGGALTLTRRVSRDTARRGDPERQTYTLFFSDRAFGGFPVTLAREEARTLVAAIRRASADTAATPRRPRRRAPGYGRGHAGSVRPLGGSRRIWTAIPRIAPHRAALREERDVDPR